MVEIKNVDPRDQTWEVDQPSYRVYFHDADGTSEEYEISSVDVGEVLAWAEERRGRRSYVLYACIPSRGLGLVRLAGTDPNDASPFTPTSSKR